jgi:hypothetical protein
MEKSVEGRAYILDLSLVSVLNDAPGAGNKSLVLESYFNDLYKLLIRKLSEFECQAKVSEVENVRLRALLNELLKVKGMISGREEIFEESHVLSDKK